MGGLQCFVTFPSFFYGILSYRSAVALQTLETMDCHISLSLSLVICNICSALLPSPAVPIIPSIYFSLCLALALQPGILLSVKFCSPIFSLLFMGNYPIFCMFLLDVPCIMLECMCVLRRLGEFPLFSLFLWETILFFLFIHLLFLSFFYRSFSFFSLLFTCVASSSDSVPAAVSQKL